MLYYHVRITAMETSLLIAVLAGLAGMLGWGLADFFAKKTIDVAGDMATLLWAHVFGTAAMVSVFLATYKLDFASQLPADGLSWLLLMGFGFLQGLIYALVYQGFGKGQLAVLNPVFSSYSGIAAALSIIVFGESIGVGRAAILGLIFMGIILVSIDTSELKNRRVKVLATPGLNEVILASGMAAFWTVFWAKFVGGQNWLAYAAVMYISMSLGVYLISLVQKVNLKIKDGRLWKFFILIGLSEVVAYVGISWGFSTAGHTSIIALLSGAFSVPTLVLAHAFLKERITAPQWGGVVTVLVGVALMTLYK